MGILILYVGETKILGIPINVPINFQTLPIGKTLLNDRITWSLCSFNAISHFSCDWTSELKDSYQRRNLLFSLDRVLTLSIRIEFFLSRSSFIIVHLFSISFTFSLVSSFSFSNNLHRTCNVSSWNFKVDFYLLAAWYWIERK